MWCFYVVAVIGAIDLVRIASASQTAFVEIRFCKKTKQSANTRTRKLRGTFTNIGSLTQAKGDVLQIHPFGLCNISNDDSFYNDEWVGVVKLTVPSQESPACNGTVQKALGAVRKGAKAVIFDITDSPGAAKELNSKRNLISHPVIIISGASAKKLMRIVNEQKVLKAKISLYPDIDQTKENAGEYVDMVIFMTCFVLITVTCFILLLKIKWRQSKKESSLAKMAFDAVSKMESKKYEEKKGVEAVKTINEKQWERKLSVHSCSVAGISCVICLEEFKEGQEIRVVSCGHEFHLTCVDPWLLTNYTCPLCMLNIVEREGNGIKTESRCSLSFRSLFSCCFASSPLTSSSMVYSVTMEEPGNDVSSVSNDTVESLQFNSLDINSSHASWTERLPARPSGDSQIWRASQGRDVSSGAHISSLGRHSVPCLTSKEKDISLLSVNASDSSPEGSFTETLDAERLQRQENRAKAVQIADLGIRKYAELGDAV